MTNLVTEINRDPAALAPIVRERLVLSLEECHENDFPAHLFEGIRSNERQLYLWTQGRTRAGKIITKAGPWRSTHVYGLGVDIVFFINGVWSWEGEFDKVANIFQRNGFKWLFPFEKCHFEITAGYTMRECEKITKARGLEHLWALIKEQAGESSTGDNL